MASPSPAKSGVAFSTGRHVIYESGNLFSADTSRVPSLGTSIFKMRPYFRPLAGGGVGGVYPISTGVRVLIERRRVPMGAFSENDALTRRKYSP